MRTAQMPVLDWAFLENGAKETRTPDPLHAMQVLYQLSYGPMNAVEALGSSVVVCKLTTTGPRGPSNHICRHTAASLPCTCT